MKIKYKPLHLQRSPLLRRLILRPLCLLLKHFRPLMLHHLQRSPLLRRLILRPQQACLHHPEKQLTCKPSLGEHLNSRR